VFDLSVFKYNRLEARESAELPGLCAAAPPKRAARGRERDRLVLFLQLGEREPQLQGAPMELLEKLSQVYFATRGTVTNALKTVAEQVNERLLARNLRQAKEGNPVLGWLILAVLHDEMLYLAQSGPVHSFIINSQGVEHFHDPVGCGRGLGVSRSVPIRFYRTSFTPGNLALLSAQPAAHWTAQSLSGSGQLSLDNLRRRLLTQADENLCFVMLRVRRGTGVIQTHALRSAESIPPAPLLASEPVVDAEPEMPGEIPATKFPPPGGQETRQAVYLGGRKPEEAGRVTGANPLRGLAARLSAALPGGKAKTEPVAQQDQAIIPPVSPPQKQSATSAQMRLKSPTLERAAGPESLADAQPKGLPATDRMPSATARRARGILRRAVNDWAALRGKIGDSLSSLTARILPGKTERLPALSNSAMLFVAIIVPILVVAIATTAYIQQGRGNEHRALVAQAEQMAFQAASQADPILKRVNYEAALGYLDQSAEFGQSEEMRSLRIEIFAALDRLEGIQRIAFSPALPAMFDPAVNIKRIVSSPAEDLYLLDGTSGQVIRLVFTRPGYEIDARFSCGPNRLGDMTIGPLVDIVAAPQPNRLEAVVMGIDARGHLLYCSLDSTKTSAILLKQPDAGWGSIRALVFTPGLLHILDNRSNAVWRFEGLGIEFIDPLAGPRLFFGNQVPDLSNAVDIAVYQNDLFILKEDGGLVLCTYSSISSTPTRCNDPYFYRVSRGGEPVEELQTLGMNLTQIQSTEPPEPSLYFLDPATPAIYQFSLGMTFVQEARPLYDDNASLPSRPVSAFRVTQARNLVIAYGNQVFVGSLTR
jgi:hypothetical protein